MRFGAWWTRRPFRHDARPSQSGAAGEAEPPGRARGGLGVLVGIGIVGLGEWGTLLAEQVARSGKAVVASVYSRNPARRRQLAEQYGCSAADSYEAMLKDPRVRGVILATPNSLHEEQIRLAAAHGKHVLVEKPIAASLASALRIARVAANSGIIVAVGHNSRRRPESRYLKRALEQGWIGQPVMVEATFSHDRGLRLKPGEWRWLPEECPSGPLTQLGVHHADTLRYLFGPVDAVVGLQRRLHAAAPIPDTTATILQFHSGCLGYIGSSYVTAPTYRIAVYGTSGSLLYDDARGLVWMDIRGSMRAVELERGDPVRDSLLEEVREFVRCICEGGQPEVTAEDGVAALAIVEAAALAAQEGRLVTIASVLRQGRRYPPHEEASR